MTERITDEATIRRMIAEHGRWWHEIEVAPGIVTRGDASNPMKLPILDRLGLDLCSPCLAELARSVGPGERRDDEVAFLHRPHVRAGIPDDTDELVAHSPPARHRLHLLIPPQIAAADARVRHGHDGIRSIDDLRIRNLLDRTSPARYITVARM